MEKLNEFVESQNDEAGIENVLNNFKTKKTMDNNLKFKNNNIQKIYNRVAKKFNLIVYIWKVFGYFIGFISLIVLSQNDNFLTGLLVCVITCIITWFSTLIFEAIAEGLQLLEDIKNK